MPDESRGPEYLISMFWETIPHTQGALIMDRREYDRIWLATHMLDAFPADLILPRSVRVERIG